MRGKMLIAPVVFFTLLFEAGKRLPTIEELREMYKNKDTIGGFTDGFDAGGWPYWAERATFRIKSGVGAYVRCVK